MRVIVCGGRDYADRLNVFRWLDLLFAPIYGDGDEPYKNGSVMPRPDLFLILGVAGGADSHAEDWAVVNWVSYKVFAADWDKHGKSAGPIRNQRMLDDGKPDLVMAFPGGKGTEHMKTIARPAGVAVLEIQK